MIEGLGSMRFTEVELLVVDARQKSFALYSSPSSSAENTS